VTRFEPRTLHKTSTQMNACLHALVETVQGEAHTRSPTPSRIAHTLCAPSRSHQPPSVTPLRTYSLALLLFSTFTPSPAHTLHPQDGSFWMPWADFYKHFESVRAFSHPQRASACAACTDSSHSAQMTKVLQNNKSVTALIQNNKSVTTLIWKQG
jgi:hypothetical protein